LVEVFMDEMNRDAFKAIFTEQFAANLAKVNK
jgi:hypothetical protein